MANLGADIITLQERADREIAKANGHASDAPITLSWASDWEEDCDYPQQLIEGMYDCKGIGAIYGPPGSGKSVLEADKCVAIGSKLKDWNGRRILNGLAVIVAAEAAEGIRRSVSSQCGCFSSSTR